MVTFKKYVPFIAAILFFVLWLLSMQRCSEVKRNANVNLDALTDTVRHYKNKLGTQTAGIKTLQLEKIQLNEIVIDKDAELKALTAAFAEVKSIVKYKTVTQYDTISIIYTDSVPCNFSFKGSLKKEWYSFTYRSTQTGFKIDSLTIPNETTVITGVKRKWFLGAETITTDITNNNPYITTTEIKSTEVVKPAPFYKKWYAWAAIGLAGGVLISK